MKKIIMAESHDYNPKNKLGDEHYAKLFAENGYKVLWLNEVYNYLTIIKGNDSYNKKKKYNKTNFIEVDSNIFIYSPFSLVLYTSKPLMNLKFVNKLSINSIVPNIRQVLEKNNFIDVDILWLTNPKYYFLKDRVHYSKMFHRLADDLNEYNNKFKSFNYFENKLLGETDAAFVVSHNLVNKNKHIRNDIEYLPNGVDLENFTKDIYEKPVEYNYDKKICIYAGAIETWFDIELINYCALKLNEINFYFVGNVRIDISALKELNNVFFLGHRAYEKIPNYLFYSDVGIIPFRVNNFIDSISPIKLYEYMSVGLNVVSTNFKEMLCINSPSYIAKNYDEFCNSIRLAIENKEKNKDRNIRFAKDNTWEKRFEVIKQYL